MENEENNKKMGTVSNSIWYVLVFSVANLDIVLCFELPSRGVWVTSRPQGGRVHQGAANGQQDK
jgi:hypothetical protein